MKSMFPPRSLTCVPLATLLASFACGGEDANSAPPLTGVRGNLAPNPDAPAEEMEDTSAEGNEGTEADNDGTSAQQGSDANDTNNGEANGSPSSEDSSTPEEIQATDPTNLQAPLFAAGSAPRILVVGDSITAGPGCYKGQLLNRLTDNGYSDFQFVGPYPDDCGAGVMHGAVSCSTAQQYTQESFEVDCFDGQFSGLAGLMQEQTPDLLMLQLGVNDVWNLRSVDAILADYSELVRQSRAANPNIVLLVAQIHQVRPDCTNEAVFNRAQELVNAVPAWASSETTEESPVLVADLWTNSDWNEADDCVHPNAAGAARMGENWFNALSPLLTPDTQ